MTVIWEICHCGIYESFLSEVRGGHRDEIFSSNCLPSRDFFLSLAQQSSKTSKFWPLDFGLVANVRYSTPICKHILPPNALDCFKVSAILSLVPIWEDDAALQYNYPAAKGNLPLTWSWTDGARPHSGLIKVEWWIGRRRTETRRSKRGNEEIAG